MSAVNDTFLILHLDLTVWMFGEEPQLAETQTGDLPTMSNIFQSSAMPDGPVMVIEATISVEQSIGCKLSNPPIFH